MQTNLREQIYEGEDCWFAKIYEWVRQIICEIMISSNWVNLQRKVIFYH